MLRSIAILTATVATVALAMPAAADVRPGQAAPNFAAKDTKGNDVSLAALKGKTVVLEWTNHLCPYTAKHYASGNMQALQAEATKQGVVWITVVSSNKGEQGYVTAAEADKLTVDRKAAPTSFLLDPSGKLGRLYGAKTTPHMYVIDAKGTLVYAGAIDDKPTANRADIAGARNYVREALNAVKAGKPVEVSATRAYGCSVKYAPVS